MIIATWERPLCMNGTENWDRVHTVDSLRHIASFFARVQKIAHVGISSRIKQLNRKPKLHSSPWVCNGPVAHSARSGWFRCCTPRFSVTLSRYFSLANYCSVIRNRLASWPIPVFCANHTRTPEMSRMGWLPIGGRVHNFIFFFYPKNCTKLSAVLRLINSPPL